MVTEVEYTETADAPDAGASPDEWNAVNVGLIERLRERISADGGRPGDFTVETEVLTDPEDLLGTKRVRMTAVRRGAQRG